MKRIVHFLLYGSALCGAGMPNDWPKEDRWVSHLNGSILDVTCIPCRLKYRELYGGE